MFFLFAKTSNLKIMKKLEISKLLCDKNHSMNSAKDYSFGIIRQILKLWVQIIQRKFAQISRLGNNEHV